MKFRLQDSEAFRYKLVRKMLSTEQNALEFPYTKENLFAKIGDLAGYRILHLHTRQFEQINQHLIPLLEESTES